MIHGRGPAAGRPAPVCLHQSQIPLVGMSHEFIDAELGIGVLFFLVMAQPDCGPRASTGCASECSCCASIAHK